MTHPKVKLIALNKMFPAASNETNVHAVNNVNLEIYPGEFFALLGPSGCGKSTTLRLIAGFEHPTSGEILIDGQRINDAPAYQRPVNTVFQDYALFPHMNILNNVMFGLRMEGLSKDEAMRRAHEALEMVQLPNVAKRKPGQISGGQQQRVALARALVKRPRVLLLDEPLGALDLKLRRQMQVELKLLQRELGITFIFVTHDQEEAMTMANRIAVMNNGRVLQVGRPEEIYEHPADRFVAGFVGEMNFLHATILKTEGDALHIAVGDTTATVTTRHSAFNSNSAITLAVRPERVTVRSVQNNPEQIQNSTFYLQGSITDIHYIGTDIRYLVLLDDKQELTVRLQNTDPINQQILALHDRVDVLWQSAYTQILPA